MNKVTLISRNYIDRDRESAVSAEQTGYSTQVENATDENILQSAGIIQAKVLAAFRVAQTIKQQKYSAA